MSPNASANARHDDARERDERDSDEREAEPVEADEEGDEGDAERPRVLFVDNFDSFTYNLVEYVGEHADCEVVRNTASVADVREYDPDGIVVSPGPGHPRKERDVGVSNAVFGDVAQSVPTLGVCLGLEAAVYAYGGSVGRAPEPVHGKAWTIEHDGDGVFADLPAELRGGRYHSLIATDVPECFEVTATATHGGERLVMGVRHREHPIECVQFHPESVLTARGHDLVENFVRGL